MLTTLNHLVHHMFGNGFRDSLLHHVPRDKGEADRPTVSQILLLTLPEGRKELLSFSPQSLPITLTFWRLIKTSFALTSASSLSMTGVTQVSPCFWETEALLHQNTTVPLPLSGWLGLCFLYKYIDFMNTNMGRLNRTIEDYHIKKNY